jgi:hypothetical protein
MLRYLDKKLWFSGGGASGVEQEDRLNPEEE